MDIDPERRKGMPMPRLNVWVVVLTACALAGPTVSSARADFLAGFSGNTQMSDGFSPKSVVSFAVFANTGGGDFVTAINTALGLSGGSALSVSALTGGGSIDTTAKFVYLYQVTNLAGTFQDLKVANPSAFTSAGFFCRQGLRRWIGKPGR